MVNLDRNFCECWQTWTHAQQDKYIQTHNLAYISVHVIGKRSNFVYKHWHIYIYIKIYVYVYIHPQTFIAATYTYRYAKIPLVCTLIANTGLNALCVVMHECLDFRLSKDRLLAVHMLPQLMFTVPLPSFFLWMWKFHANFWLSILLHIFPTAEVN